MDRKFINKYRSVKQLYHLLDNNKIINFVITGENTNLFALDEYYVVEFEFVDFVFEHNGLCYFRIEIFKRKFQLDFYSITDYGIILSNVKNSIFTAVTTNWKKINSNKLYSKY